MELKSIYFEPLDLVYERIFPIFDSGLLARLKPKYLSALASALKRSQYFDEAVLNGIVLESIKREVEEFEMQEEDGFRSGNRS